MIRELFMAAFILSLALTVALWFGSGPRLDVRQIEANLAK
jgi:hypothetical protein